MMYIIFKCEIGLFRIDKNRDDKKEITTVCTQYDLFSRLNSIYFFYDYYL